MLDYIFGKVVNQKSNLIVIDNQGLGFSIYVANPFSFKLDEEIKVYLYNYIKEDEYSLYGFKTLEERDLFLKLINVKGLGPKVVMSMFAKSSLATVIDAIEKEDIIYLTKFPKIGEKLARQIILDLKGKLVKSEEKIDNRFDELICVLEKLGYKNSEIKKILPKLDNSKDLELQVKEALKLMIK